jgi:hypothetical protein
MLMLMLLLILMLIGMLMRRWMLNLTLELMSKCVLMLMVMLMVKAVLFIVQAEDEIVNPWSELRHDEVRKSVGEQLLRHPNMNATGRLPGFGMLHIGTRMRLIQSVEPPKRS